MVVIPIKFFKHLLHWRPDLQQQGKDDEQRLPEQTLYLVFYTWPNFYEMKIWKVSFASPCLSSSSTPHYSRHCHHITHPHCSWRPAGRSRCRSGWCSCCAGSPAPPRGTWRSPPAAWSPPGFQSFPMIELKNQSFNHCHDHSNQQPIIGNIITWEHAPQKKTKLKELQATGQEDMHWIFPLSLICIC